MDNASDETSPKIYLRQAVISNYNRLGYVSTSCLENAKSMGSISRLLLEAAKNPLSHWQSTFFS